jgi:AraC-like DNA-binding protein
MLRHEIPVAPHLQADVRNFWGLEADAASFNLYSVMPDSYVELIINAGAPLYLTTADGARLATPQVFLNGVQRAPLHLSAAGQCQVIAVKLYPWTVTARLGVPALQTTATLTPLDGRWQAFGQSVIATLHARGYAEALYQLQDFVGALRPAPPPDLPAIRTAMHTLYDAGGQLRVHRLAAQTAFSTSQFERRFKYFTGLTPKSMARVIRFETVRNLLFTAPLGRTAHLAQDLGYADQAHFIHDFKAFARMTPGEFITVHGQKWREAQAWPPAPLPTAG